MRRSAAPTAAPGPSGLRSRRRGTSRRADWSRIPWCRIRISSVAFCCALAWLAPATKAIAASARIDRLKADFIASLPMQPVRLRMLFILNVSRDELWSVVRWVRRRNASTSSTGEKRALRGPVRRKQIDGKFSDQVARPPDALHCGNVPLQPRASISGIQWAGVIAINRAARHRQARHRSAGA